MAQFDRLWKLIKKGNWKVLLSFIILLLLIVILFKGCSTKSTPQNTFKIAYDGTWYPLQITEKEKNMVGFSTELILDIADKQALQIEMISIGTEALLDGLDNGLYDAILTGMNPNAIQRRYYTFSNPYFLVGPVLVVSKNSPIHSFTEMTRKTVGIKSGESLQFDVPQPTDMTLIPYNYTLAAFADLDKGLIDGVIIDLFPAYTYTTGFYAGRLRIASAPLNNIGIRLAIRKSTKSDQLISRFNEGLDKLKSNGTYQQLLQRWGLYQTSLSNLKASEKP